MSSFPGFFVIVKENENIKKILKSVKWKLKDYVFSLKWSSHTLGNIAEIYNGDSALVRPSFISIVTVFLLQSSSKHNG